MKNHETDNDFLDELYAQSAKEVPPKALDQAILKQAHATAPKPDRVSLFQWQRFLSVAAVMVLSVYIFFDVGGYSMDAEVFSPTEERIRSEAPVFDEGPASRSQEQGLKAEKSKAKKMTAPALNESTTAAELTSAPSELSDSIGEQKFMSKSEEETDVIHLKNDVVRSLNKQQVTVEQASSASASNTGESSMLDAEKMLREIECLMAASNLVDAKKIYQRLSDLYPEYPVPNEIVTAFK
jgi:hypothetical protein